MADRLDFNDLLKWSLTHQETFPTAAEENPEPLRQLSVEDQQFLMDAMDNKVMDEQKRVKVLLQVLRLPQDPTLLHQFEHVTNDHQLPALKDKKQLRTLLEMRHEDDQRKRFGFDIIGAEYIPGNVLTIQELLKKQLILKHLNESPPPSPAPPTIDENDDSFDPIAFSRKIKKEHLDNITILVENELPQHIQSTLQSIPQPTDSNLHSIYDRIRDEKLDSFEEIEDRTHRGDNAIGFVTFNGIPILKQYLLSNDYEIAAEAWRLLGNIVSNQPFCQQKAVEYNLIPLAIEALNITRYLPSILAAYTYSQSTSTTTTSTTQQLPSPKTKSCPVSITNEQYQTLMNQYEFKQDDLYNYSHFGRSYIQFILPLMKSILYFISTICNNNSTAQTQFIQHHGLIPLAHLLQLGTTFISSPTNNDEQSTTTTSFDSTPTSVAAQILTSLVHVSESVFKQILRRVFQLLILFVDDEYQVTTSGEICQALFQQVQSYHTFSKQIQYQLGHAIFNYTPQSHSAQTTASNFANAMFTSNDNNNNDTNNNNNQSNNNIDEGKPRVHFQEPIAPLRLEDSTEIHPAFKLKNHLSGGKLNQDGDHIETQIFLTPFTSLFIPIFFPFQLWSIYMTCNEFDRELVISSERLLSYVAKNYYKLTTFNTDLSHLQSKETITSRQIINKPTPQDIQQWCDNDYQLQKQNNGKFSTLFHQLLATQIALNQPEQTIQQSIQKVLQFLDTHVKHLISISSVGPKTQQDIQREHNREEMKFIGIIKPGINQ